MAEPKRKSAAKVPADCMPMCKNCVFGRMEKTEPTGLCHRHPPVFAGETHVDVFAFPTVSPADWCGEFIRRVT